MRRIWIVMAMASFAAQAAESHLSEFGEHLTGLRESCVQQALHARGDIQAARGLAAMQAQSASRQAEMDADVYRIGHGERETSAFIIDRAQQNAAADSVRDKEIADQHLALQQKVEACVTGIQDQGKSAYSDFKKQNKSSAQAAEDLMVAWLANVGEITLDLPKGGDATDAAWKSAKAHAELSSL